MAPLLKNKFVRPIFLNQPRYNSIGYVLASSPSDKSNEQLSILKNHGCNLVFQEFPKISSNESVNYQLHKAIEVLSAGDELVVLSLNHLGKTQRKVLDTIHELQTKKKHLRAIDGSINTRQFERSTASFISLLSALAKLETLSGKDHQLEYPVIPRQCAANLGGRPKTNQAKANLVIRLRGEGCSYRSIRNQTGLALSTIRRIVIEE